ncbi:MAG: hypothetical protein ABJD07_04375 [Gemmatimonadaceae bacterium]
MTAPSIAGVESPWEAEGRRIADTFDGLTSAVLVTSEPAAAALLALGIARVQARRRRVAIADCFGEISQLQAVLPRDAVHGIVDSFSYGVSLSKIAYPIDAAQNLLIMPSGASPLDHEMLLNSDRWLKLARDFKEVDALLLIIAPGGAPGLDAVVASTEGAVRVGDPQGMMPEPVLQEVRIAVEPEPARVAVARPPSTSGAPARVTTGDTRAFDDELKRRVTLFGGGVAVLVVVLGSALWFTSRSAPREAAPRVTAPAAAVGAEAAAASARPGSAMRVENPQDSARATPYGIDLVQQQAYNNAIVQLEQYEPSQQQPLQRFVPATTISPITVNQTTSFHVVAGAYATRAQADSLLSRMRDDRQITPGNGRVIRVPFALLVERGVARANAASFVSSYRRLGLPVYALLQDEGTANLYAGAWESPEQAATLRDTFTQSGKDVTLVYRTGRIP